MSRNSLTRNDRFAQMTKQEEVIAKKRQEILDKQRTAELGKAVAAAQSVAGKAKQKDNKKDTSVKPGPSSSSTNITIAKDVADAAEAASKKQNTFCNDGSFLTHFKKILEANKAEKKQVVAQEPSAKSESTATTETVSKVENIGGGSSSNTSNNPMPTQNITQQNVPSSVSVSMHNIPPLIPDTSTAAYSSFQPIMQAPQIQHFHPNAFFHTNIPHLMTSQPNVPPPPPPPPLLQQIPSIPPLYMIPPPEPLQLNNIPPPKELDLNAIPKPELNLDAIQVPPTSSHSDNNDSITIPTTLQSLIDLVADNGDEYEENLRKRKNDVHPSLWFLFETDSEKYRIYRSKVISLRTDQPSLPQEQGDKYDPESVINNHEEDSDEEYMKGMMNRNRNNLKRRIECRNELSDEEREEREQAELARQKKRKSRWGEKIDEEEDDIGMMKTTFSNQNKPMLSMIQRTDPSLLQYARQNYGSTNLSEDDWQKCEEHFKVNLLYQDMMKKREEIDRLAMNGKFKYEYDSDEDINGGTWEHKLRNAEMEASQAWASALTKQSEGKHHIGDFLPPEELKKFMEQYEAKKNNRQPDLSDYKEYKLKEDNIGFQMLQKLGWKEGQGLGTGGSGIVDPVNKAPQREGNMGLGVNSTTAPENCDNEYEAYRKRMMLAYRFRPNPLV